MTSSRSEPLRESVSKKLGGNNRADIKDDRHQHKDRAHARKRRDQPLDHPSQGGHCGDDPEDTQDAQRTQHREALGGRNQRDAHRGLKPQNDGVEDDDGQNAVADEGPFKPSDESCAQLSALPAGVLRFHLGDFGGFCKVGLNARSGGLPHIDARPCVQV